MTPSEAANMSVGFRHALLLLCARVSPEIILTVDPSDPMNQLPDHDHALRLATLVVTNPQTDGVSLGATVELLNATGFAYVTFRSIRSIRVRGGLEQFSFVDLGRLPGEVHRTQPQLTLIPGGKTT